MICEFLLLSRSKLGDAKTSLKDCAKHLDKKFNYPCKMCGEGTKNKSKACKNFAFKCKVCDENSK